MPVNPFLVSFDVIQPTAQVPTATVVVIIDRGDSFGPFTLEIPGVTAGREALSGGPPTPVPSQYSYSKSGVAPGGPYVVTVYDASPAPYPDFSFNVTVNPPPLPVPGCTDPDADNYDPAATQDNGSCLFSPHLLLGSLPELAPVGVPLLVSLAAQPVAGAVAGAASLLLDLANLGGTAGVQLRVDGYLFTSGPLIVPNRFTDAGSLLDALRGQPALVAAYTLSQPAPTQLLLTARLPGVPGTPAVSSTDPVAVAATLTAGVAGLWSERRPRWGCYLEVWAGCGPVFGGPVDKATATLAQRLVLAYRPDNTYVFDIAAALSQFTGHAYPLVDGSCPDRLVSYFVRFGEEYATDATSLPRPRTTYESLVAWGLEAMELPPQVAGRFLLSARPGPWAVAAGTKVPAFWLCEPVPAARTLLRYRLATSRSTTDVVLGHQVATGYVSNATDKLLAPAGALSGELRASDAQGVAGPVLLTLQFGATGQGLTFVNRQGSTDTFYFSGLADPATKRTASAFTAGAGAQLLAAEATLPTRLYSGLLTYEVWAWLRRELAVSPAAWLETGTGPVPVRLTDVATDPDPIKGEYALTVEYELGTLRGLSN